MNGSSGDKTGQIRHLKDDSFVIAKKNRTKALKAIQVQVPEGTEVEGWLASLPFPLSLPGWVEEDNPVHL